MGEHIDIFQNPKQLIKALTLQIYFMKGTLGLWVNQNKTKKLKNKLHRALTK